MNIHKLIPQAKAIKAAISLLCKVKGYTEILLVCRVPPGVYAYAEQRKSKDVEDEKNNAKSRLESQERFIRSFLSVNDQINISILSSNQISAYSTDYSNEIVNKLRQKPGGAFFISYSLDRMIRRVHGLRKLLEYKQYTFMSLLWELEESIDSVEGLGLRAIHYEPTYTSTLQALGVAM
jgi:hypothetical protein